MLSSHRLHEHFSIRLRKGAIDYIDAYHAALLQARGDPRLYSFDRDFDKVAGLTRMEP